MWGHLLPAALSHTVLTTVELPPEGAGLFVPCDHCATAPVTHYAFGPAPPPGGLGEQGEAAAGGAIAAADEEDKMLGAASGAWDAPPGGVPLFALRAPGEEALCDGCWEGQYAKLAAREARRQKAARGGGTRRAPSAEGSSRGGGRNAERLEVVGRGRWCKVTLCVDCEWQLASRRCTECQDAFCDTCFAAAHRSTSRSHAWTPLVAPCADCGCRAAAVAARPRFVRPSSRPRRRSSAVLKSAEEGSKPAAPKVEAVCGEDEWEEADVGGFLAAHGRKAGHKAAAVGSLLRLTAVGEFEDDDDDELVHDIGGVEAYSGELELLPRIGDGEGAGGRPLCRECHAAWANGREGQAVTVAGYGAEQRFDYPFAPAALPLRTCTVALWRAAADEAEAVAFVAAEKERARQAWAERQRARAATCLAAHWRGVAVRCLEPWVSWRAVRTSWLAQRAEDDMVRERRAGGGMAIGASSQCGAALGCLCRALLWFHPRDLCARVRRCGRGGPGPGAGALATDSAEECALRHLPTGVLMPAWWRCCLASAGRRLCGGGRRGNGGAAAAGGVGAGPPPELMSALAGRRHVSECVRGRWEKLRLVTPLSEEHVHEARRRLGCATAGGGAGGRTQKPPPHPAAVWREAVGVAREMELAEEQKKGARAGQGDGAAQRKRRQTKAPKQQRRQTKQGHRYTAVELASAEPPRSRYAVDWARLATLVQREARDGERLGAVTVSAARGARLLRCSADVGGALWHGDRVRVVLSSSAAKAGTTRPEATAQQAAADIAALGGLQAAASRVYVVRRIKAAGWARCLVPVDAEWKFADAEGMSLYRLPAQPPLRDAAWRVARAVRASRLWQAGLRLGVKADGVTARVLTRFAGVLDDDSSVGKAARTKSQALTARQARRRDHCTRQLSAAEERLCGGLRDPGVVMHRLAKKAQRKAHAHAPAKARVWRSAGKAKKAGQQKQQKQQRGRRGRKAAPGDFSSDDE